MNNQNESTSWLGMLAAELSMITPEDYIEPREEINPDMETLEGTASEEVKRLYTLMMRMDEKATRTGVDAKYAQDRTEQKELIMRANALSKKADVIKEITFTLVRDSEALWLPEHVGLGLRVGFKIVTYKRRQGPETGGPPRGIAFFGFPE